MKLAKQNFVKGKIQSASEDGVVSIGSIEFDEMNDLSQYAVVSLEHLKQSIKSIEQINKTECTIRIESNQPVLISPGNSKNSKIGVLIAPRMPGEER